MEKTVNINYRHRSGAGRYAGYAAMLVGAALVLFGAVDAFAAGGLGDMGGHLKSEAKSLWTGIDTLIMMAGTLMFVVGIVQAATAGKRQQSPMGGVVLALIGGALIGYQTLVGMSSVTFSGDETGKANVESGLFQ